MMILTNAILAKPSFNKETLPEIETHFKPINAAMLRISPKFYLSLKFSIYYEAKCFCSSSSVSNDQDFKMTTNVSLFDFWPPLMSSWFLKLLYHTLLTIVLIRFCMASVVVAYGAGSGPNR